MKPRLALVALLALACDPPRTSDPSPDMAGAAGPDLAPAPGCVQHEPLCQDKSILALALYKDPPTAGRRTIKNEPDGSGFLSSIDATAGGSDAKEAYVYARFTDAGLTRVQIGDEAAFASLDWDIAFRRYVARLNSGVSGPGCVVGADEPGGDFEALKAAPEGLVLDEESYFDDKCKLIEDSSGLGGTPATVLAEYWQYQGCVQMTGRVYVLRLGDGRHVKLTFTGYYEPAAQEACDKGAPEMGAIGGRVRVRWAFLGK